MRKTILPFLVLLTACVSSTTTVVAPPPCHPADATINATLWMQTSAEYEAITREIYGTAERTLGAALGDPTWSAVPDVPVSDEAEGKPAIILDLDETVLDTSAHQTGLIRAQKGFTEEEWHAWAMNDASRPIEAARQLLQAASGKGIAVFFITNRLQGEEEALRKTLAAHGLPLAAGYDNVLTRGERDDWKASDKTPRRAFVASHYRVLMMFGDDLNDFVAANGKTLAERSALVRKYAQNWGVKWYAIPNPVYGSWERSALGDTKGMTDCQQFDRKINLLRP